MLCDTPEQLYQALDPSCDKMGELLMTICQGLKTPVNLQWVDLPNGVQGSYDEANTTLKIRKGGQDRRAFILKVCHDSIHHSYFT